MRAALRTGLGTVAAALTIAAPAHGATAVRGDFDGDGYGDLAVGAPADSVQGQPGAGAVNVLYGAPRGLTSRDQEFTKAPRSIAGAPQPGARFGAALASGDIDADGHADLAIGAPAESGGGLREAARAGAVTVLYGSPSGLHPRPSAGGFTQNSAGVNGAAEARDQFGAALAIADFDGDGHDDLAIGVPGESIAGQANAGAVNILYGGSRGLRTAGDQLWHQDDRGIKGIAGENHRFGMTLAAGDMSGNGRAELAIGIPGGVIGGDREAGAVSVLYGRSGGLSSVDDLWSQDARGIKGGAEPGDRFGHGLAIGDFDGDGIGDLAIGAPTDSVGNAAGAGVVNVIRGSRSGLTARGDQLWTENSPGITGRASIGERFGSALVAGDFSRNHVADLAIGIPGTQVGPAVEAGAVAVLYGKRGRGLTQRAERHLDQDSFHVKGVAERGDRFGTSVGAGDVDGDGALDLFVGVPGESVGAHRDAGAVNVLHGSRTGIRTDPDGLWTQATHGVKGAVGNDHLGEAVAPGHGG
jgi:hypothetical protein